MDERDTQDPLRGLEERLDKARRGRRQATTPAARGESAANRDALGLGLRIGVELVVAVAVGAGVGWAIDRGLGTKPWGMILFLFLGIGAGMWNVYRTVTGMGMAMGFKRGIPPVTGERKGTGWDDDED